MKQYKHSAEANGGDALSLHIAGQAYTGANGVSSTLSSAFVKSISQMLVETPSAKAAPTRLDHCADKSIIRLRTLKSLQHLQCLLYYKPNKNNKGTSKIFHANKKNIKEFERLQKQAETGSRVAHFLHPDIKSAWAGSNEHLPAKDIIPLNLNHIKGVDNE